MKNRNQLLGTCLLALLPIAAANADVTEWLNNGSSVFDSANAPVFLEDNIAWKTPLDSTSNATPILVKGKLFFTEEPSSLVCADAATGEILWKHANGYQDVYNYTAADKAKLARLITEIRESDLALQRLRNNVKRLERADNKATLETKKAELAVAEAAHETLTSDPIYSRTHIPQAHQTNGYTSYTPTSDGQLVYASFGLGVVVAYDLKGNRIWAKAMDKPDHGFGGSTMPRLVDGKLIVRFSNLTALDPKTGDEIWSVPSKVYFGTPTAFKVEGKTFLFTPNGLVIDPANGATIDSGLISISTRREWAQFNTPALEGDILYTVNGERDLGYAYAFRIPKTITALKSSGLERIWKTDVHANRYYATPLIYDNLMYCITRDKVMTVLEADTGDVVYTHTYTGFKGEAYPSIVAASGNLYVGIDDGNLVVIKPGRTYQEIANNKLSPYRSTLIFSNEYAYLRAYDSIQAFTKN